MIKMKWLGAFGIALLLNACGGGGGSAGTSPFVPPPPTNAVADLSLVLSKSTINNSGSDTLTATVTAVDANRIALADVPVTIAADSNAVVVASAATTDSLGRVTATISNGQDKSDRAITVTAISGGLTRSTTFTVAGSTLTGTGVEVIAPGATGTVTYRLTDSSSNRIPGVPITIAAAGLPEVSGTTDANGEFIYSYVAPGTTGPLNITATTNGVTQVKTVIVETTAIAPATGVVTSPSLVVDPSVVRIGGDPAELRARFIGANNAPIARIRVRFDLAGDPNSIGGTISSGSEYVYSDASGIALASYSPGTRSSPTDGVLVRACWDYNDFPAGSCPNAVIKTLTVTSDALSVTIGYDNTIEEGPSRLTWIKRFVVTVNDSAGQAKAAVLVTPSVDLVNYYKGFYMNPGAWVKARNTGCTNEDTNRNGVLEAGEDFNRNNKLDPRKADVLVSVEGDNRTSANGTVVLQIEYPKNIATWVDFRLLATAGAVAGTEGRAAVTLNTEGAESEFTAQVAPSFHTSPYGVATTCSDPN